MSAVPEDFMRDPTRPDDPQREPREREPVTDEAGGTWWQWLAIGVLVGCWLAEATWCMENGF